MNFKPMDGNVIKSIELVHSDGRNEIMRINNNKDFPEAYAEMKLYKEEDDEIYIHVRSKANTPSDEQGSKIFF